MKGAASMAQTNVGREQMLVDLRNELHQMRSKIEGAEEHANVAQHIANSMEQRADAAQHAADATEQRTVTAQSNADAAQAKQARLE